MKIQAMCATLLLGSGVAPDVACQKPLTIEATAYGGHELGELYPYDASAWPVRGADHYIYYDSANVLRRSDGASLGYGFAELSALTGGSASVVAAYAGDRVLVQGDSCLLLVGPGGAPLRRLDVAADDVRPSNDPARLAWTQGSDLFVCSDFADATTGPGKTRVNGQREPGVRYGGSVHRSEFGIEHGVFWAPDARRLAYYRCDEQLVGLYPLVDVRTPLASTVPTRYPMAGTASEQVDVLVYDLQSRQSVKLRPPAGNADRYFTNLSWSPDGRTLAVAELDRAQQHMQFNLYDATTGELRRTLFEESDERWVEPCEPAVWTDHNTLAWLSYRDGFRHIYLYDVPSGTCRQLTSGPWCVTRLYGWSGRALVVQTNREGYLYRSVEALTLDGKLSPLSGAGAWAEADYADHHSEAAINESSVQVAKLSYLAVLRGRGSSGQRRELQRVANPYEGYTLPDVRPLELTSADGRHKLGARLIVPADFDEHKKYPVVVYLYGGPHHQEVTGGWLRGARPWLLWLAQEGYLVFSMDNRGSDMRGSDYEQCVHRRLGECERDDQMVGIEWLRSQPYVDTTRLGIHGWSYGGFMTLNMLTAHPDVFRAGVAGGPVCDWRLYEVMYGERYMDTPAENPDGYERTSVANRIGDLRARLLVVQGAMDSTVVWQNALRLTNAAIEKGVFIDHAIFPSHPHGVSGHDNVHCVATIKRYFDDFLR